jgi:hypothetical protein
MILGRNLEKNGKTFAGFYKYRVYWYPEGRNATI